MNEGTDRSNKLLTKWDIILLFLFLCIGICSFLLVKYFTKPGGWVYIYEDGEVVQKIAISQEGSYSFQTEAGSNTVLIKDGAVSVIEADCPDLLCVKQGEINGSRETIICLPHRLVVEVRTE